MRSDAIAGTRRLPRPEHGIPRAHSSTENQPTCTVRDYGAGTHGGIRVDFPFETESRGLSFSKPHPRITAPVNSSVCPDCGFLGSSVGIGSFKLWYPYATADEGHTDLPTDKESEGSTVAPRPYQAREHSPISWYRGG